MNVHSRNLDFEVRSMYANFIDWKNVFKSSSLLFLAMYAFCMNCTEVSHNISLTYLPFANIMKPTCAGNVAYLLKCAAFGVRIATSKVVRS